MPIFFYKFSKNIVATTKLQFFRNLAVFLPALVVSYLQIQQTKHTLIYKSFTKPYCCSTQNLKRMYLWPRQDVKPSRLRLEKWEVSKPRPNLETPSLPNMSGETNILCSKCNVYLFLNQWWSLQTHFCGLGVTIKRHIALYVCVKANLFIL